MRRLSLILTLFAWLLATGAQWDVVQVFAWARMFAENIHSESVAAAFGDTVNGGLCPICKAVQRARQAESDSQSPAQTARLPRLEFVAPAAAVFQITRLPSSGGRIASLPIPLSAELSAPPAPPPRGLA